MNVTDSTGATRSASCSSLIRSKSTSLSLQAWFPALRAWISRKLPARLKIRPPFDVQKVAPALFTASANGKGVVAALGVRVERDGTQVAIPVFQCAGPLCTAERIEVSDERPVYVSLYGTGIRGASSTAAVRVTIGSTSVPVVYAGPQAQFPGLDQINVKLPGSLRGQGEVDLTLSVDGIASNTARIGIR